MAESTIAIIGAGNVGAALGHRMSKHDHKVVFGARNPGKLDGLLARCPGATVASPAEAARVADIIFLALPAAAVVDVAAGLGDLHGKVLVDCANPLRWDDGPVWSPPAEGSLSAAIAARCLGAAVVKALNTFGAEIHADPELESGHAADVPMAGDDTDAKAKVAALAKSIGFTPLDAGPLRNAAVLENHAILWIHLATVGTQGRQWAFKALARPTAQAGAFDDLDA